MVPADQLLIGTLTRSAATRLRVAALLHHYSPTMATIAQLWRFPVKSMGGSQVTQARLTRRGMHGDRLWAVRDLDNDITATARRIPALLGCTARYVTEPGPTAGAGNVPAVMITFPDGAESSSDDPTTDERLSDLTGRRVALTPLTAGTDGHRLSLRQVLTAMSPGQIRSDLGLAESDPLPDAAMFSVREMANLTRYSTPPGSFVDVAPVHVLTTASIAFLERHHGSELDVRRFRPNVLVDTGPDVDGRPEVDWVGAQLVAGSARLRVNAPTIRCVVPGRPQAGLELDRAVGRTLSAHTDRYLGVYAGVGATGDVSVGDDVTVVTPSPPTRVERLGRSALATAKRMTMRVGQATVLR